MCSSCKSRRRCRTGCPKPCAILRGASSRFQFNATLNSEIEALKYGKMIGAAGKLRRMRIGRISAHEEFEGLAEENAGNLDWDFLERLRSSGRVAADLWLRQDMPQGASRLGALRAGEAAS